MNIEPTNFKVATQELFNKAQIIINKLNEHGYAAYIVGGAVRNLLLQQPINDIDITTNCLPEKMLELFEHTIPVGIEHGTIVVLIDKTPFEVTTFRVDGEYIDHRRPDTVIFVDDLKEDLMRRDFTINALAVNSEYHVIDYFKGQDDIKQRTIKAVGNPQARFTEDALRMLRALRFQSVLDFDIEIDTRTAIQQLAHQIQYISIERIIVEFSKLLTGAGVKNALNSFYNDELFHYIPFFKHIQQPNQYIINHPVPLELYLAYIIDCELKQHNDLGQHINSLKLSNQSKSDIKDYIKLLQYFRTADDAIEMICYQYEQSMIHTAYQFVTDENLQLNTFFKTISHQKIDEIISSIPIQSRAELDINGNDLMHALNKGPGHWLKTTLNLIERKVVLNRLDNKKAQILEWVKINVEI